MISGHLKKSSGVVRWLPTRSLVDIAGDDLLIIAASASAFAIGLASNWPRPTKLI